MATPAWLRARINRPVTAYLRVPTGALDEYGNVVYGDSGLATGLCYIQPVSQIEIQDGRAEVGQFLVHLTGEVASFLNGYARLVIDGVSYEVIGPVAIYTSFSDPSPHHAELIVQRSTA